MRQHLDRGLHQKDCAFPMLAATLTSPFASTQSPFSGSVRKKVFDFGSPVALDRSQKQLCLAFCEALQRFKLLSRSHVAVFHALLYDFHNSRSGLCFPAFEALAEKAGVSRRTVARSLVLFERFGLVSWVHRLRRTVVKGAVVPVRSSNSYAFRVPASVEAAESLARSFAAAAGAALSGAARRLRLVAAHVAAAALSSVASIRPAPPSVSQGALAPSLPPPPSPPSAPVAPVAVSSALEASLSRLARRFGAVLPSGSSG